MGKSIIVEEVIKSYADKVSKEKQFKIGLVIGQSVNCLEKEYVVHLAPTPLTTENDENEVEEKSRTSSQSKNVSLEDWSIDLVVQHAAQVTRMLVGGFDVLGLFICTPTETILPPQLAHIRQLISSIHKKLSQDNYFSNFKETERLLIHISCVPYKISGKTLSVTSSLASPKPIELKFVTNPTKWTKLNCQFLADLHIPQDKESSRNPLTQQFKSALKPICEQIDTALATLDGRLKSNDDILEPCDESPKKGKRGGEKKRKAIIEESQQQTSIDVDLLVTSKADSSEAVVKQDCDVVMKFSGTITGRTYAPPNCTVEEGLKILKLDLLRSLVSRCDIHCEDLLVIEEEQQDRVVVHELPRRVFAPLAGLDLTVSDYLFPGETTANSLDAFKELLNLSPNEEDMEDSYERFLESSDLTYPVMEKSDKGVPVEEMLPVKPPKSCNYICVCLSVFVGVFATAVSFYFVKT